MKKPTILLVLLLGAVAMLRAQSGQLTTLYSQSDLDRMLPAPGQFRPVPTAADAYWQSLPSTLRQSYISNAQRVANPDWSQIPTSLFAEYRQNGNRSHYESQSFTRRNNLARLVMGEIMEHRGRFIPQILNGLDYLKKELWWGVPAHYAYSAPDSLVQTVDLFNAETANTVAWTIYMLSDELEAARPGITADMKKEVQRRLLVPAINDTYYWMSTAGNWNSWISENWLACALLCETERTRQLRGVNKIMTDLDAFASKYSPDGGCDEGVGYWDRAAGSYFECSQLLYLGTNGGIDMRGDRLLHDQAAYIYNMYVGGGLYVNYADAAASTTPNVNMLYPYARFVSDTVLARMGAYVARSRNFSTSPANLFNTSGNWPSISRELTFLARYYRDLTSELPAEPLVSDSWYPNIQVMTARSTAGSSAGLFFSAKGGNNDEAHNHNDLGNFVVYRNSAPLIVDIGQCTYTAATFDANLRYTLMNTRSAYHNVPLINGYEQQAGASYRSTNVSYERRGDVVTFSQDLAKAYPAEAGVKSWMRTFTFDRSAIKVRERYSLASVTQAPELHFMLTNRPTTVSADTLMLRSTGGSCYMTFDTAAVSATIESVSLADVGAASLWNNMLYRLVLKAKSTATTDVIDYNITQVGATLKPTPTAVTLSAHQVELNYDTLATQLTATLSTAGTASYCTWTSSDPQVAVVGPTGGVTATGSGRATITCTTAEGRKDSCQVHVAQGIVSVDVFADTYVDAANPAQNYGYETTLQVKKADAASDRAAYLRFPLKGTVPAQVTAAQGNRCKLVLYINEVGSFYEGMTWNVYPLSAVRWTETGLTYNTARSYRPTLTNLLDAVAERPASDTLMKNRVEFDVTTYTLSRLNSASVAYYLTQNINPGNDNSGTAFASHDDLDVTVHPRLVFYVPELVNGIHQTKANAGTERVNVYTIDGVPVRRQVEAAGATTGLRPGLYIVGNRKVLVK